MQVAIVDAGPLIAAVDPQDVHHEAAANALQAGGVIPVIPTLVVTEAIYVIGRRMGPLVESSFLRGLQEFEIRGPAGDDWRRIGDLVYEYRDFPLGGADASVVALAESLGTDLLITLDHRHFATIKPRHCAAFHLLPSR